MLFALIIILSINSCKKEDSDLKQNTTDLITNAKQAFIDQIAINQNYQLLSSNSKKSFRHSLAKSPDWKNAAIKTLRKGKAVMVPIEYEKDIFLKVGDIKNSYQSLKTLSYLLIYDNKEKAKRIEWVTLIPDNVSESNKGTKFTGKVIIEDWAGNFKKGYLFNKEGKIFNLIIKNENSGGPKIQSNDVKVNDVYCVSTPWYEQGFYTNENGDLVGSGYRLGGYDTNCYDTGSPYEDDYTNPSGETDGNHGETFPSDYVETIDIILLFNNHIDDLALTPCMQTILKDLKTLSNGSIAGIITKFAGQSPSFNWKLTNGPLPTNINATTSQIYTAGTVTSVFDNQKMTSSSDLSIARTILHESVHAYLVAYLRSDPNAATKTYAQLLLDYQTLKDANTSHHIEMTRSFVNDIALALNEYGVGKGYNFSSQFYKDLAWGGLTTTPAFGLLNTTGRARIENVILVEQTGVDTNGNIKTQNGIPAGC